MHYGQRTEIHVNTKYMYVYTLIKTKHKPHLNDPRFPDDKSAFRCHSDRL